MSTVVTLVHVLVCLVLIGTVLLQQGKGGGMGGAFGGANTQTVFGSGGASVFLRRLTAGCAVVFMLTSMLLAYFASNDAGDALKSYSAEQSKLKKRKKDAENRALDGTGAGTGEGTGTGDTDTGTDTDTEGLDTPDPTGAEVDDGDTGEDEADVVVPAPVGDDTTTAPPAEKPADPTTPAPTNP